MIRDGSATGMKKQFLPNGKAAGLELMFKYLAWHWNCNLIFVASPEFKYSSTDCVAVFDFWKEGHFLSIDNVKIPSKDGRYRLSLILSLTKIRGRWYIASIEDAHVSPIYPGD